MHATLFENQIMRMHMLTRPDLIFGDTNCMSVTINLRSRGDDLQGQFVPGGNGLADFDPHACRLDILPGREGHTRDRDVIVSMQPDYGVLFGRRAFDFV